MEALPPRYESINFTVTMGSRPDPREGDQAMDGAMGGRSGPEPNE